MDPMRNDPWAKLRGKLFASDDGHLNACINFARDRDALNTGYIEGYRRGAVRLFEHIVDANRDQDFLIYPIVFLWRQCVELQLKEILALGSQVEGGAYEHPVDHHDLVVLWKDARPIMERMGSDRSPLVYIDRHLTELSAIDPKSFAFRFPYKKDLKTASLVSAPSVIGLQGLHDVMSEISTLLDGCTYILREHLGELLSQMSERY